MKKKKIKQNKNLYLMKLLTTSNEFQSDITQIRKNFFIPSEGFLNGEELEKWNEKLCQDSDDFWYGEDYKKMRRKLLILKEKNYKEFLAEQELINNEVPINKFNKSIEKIKEKYNLPYNFSDAIKTYIYYDKIIPLHLPYSNYSISFSRNNDKKIQWIELRSYAYLTEKEIRGAIKNLKTIQEHYLPVMLNKKFKIRKDIDEFLNIEKEMKRRVLKRKEIPDDYLIKIKKQYGEKEYESVKKINPYRLTKEKKYTSKEIAKKILKDKKKANLIRQRYSRMQKERKEIFGI